MIRRCVIGLSRHCRVANRHNMILRMFSNFIGVPDSFSTVDYNQYIDGVSRDYPDVFKLMQQSLDENKTNQKIQENDFLTKEEAVPVLFLSMICNYQSSFEIEVKTRGVRREYLKNGDWVKYEDLIETSINLLSQSMMKSLGTVCTRFGLSLHRVQISIEKLMREDEDFNTDYQQMVKSVAQFQSEHQKSMVRKSLDPTMLEEYLDECTKEIQKNFTFVGKTAQTTAMVKMSYAYDWLYKTYAIEQEDMMIENANLTPQLAEKMNDFYQLMMKEVQPNKSN